jgi:hypothetical protein
MTEQSKMTKRLYAWHLAAGSAIVMVAWLAFSFRSLTTVFEAYQVSAFNTYFPALTFLLLLAGPIALGAIAWRLKYRDEPAPTSARGLMIAQAWRSYQAFVGFSGLAGLLLLFLLISWSISPGDGGPRPRLDAEATELARGGVTLIGRTVAGEAVIYEKRILFASRRMQFVPVETVGAAHPAVRYIIEVPPTSVRGDRTEYAGIAVHNGLPEQVIERFTGAGYTIARPYAVIYNNADSLNWSTKVLALQLMLVLIVLCVAAFFQRIAYKKVLASADPA